VPRHNEERAFLAPMVPQNHSDSVAPSATLTIPELEQSEAAKRACSCFGLGRYFYDFLASWVDLDQHRQPARTPALPAWAIRENRRKGMRPSGKNGNGKGNVTKLGIGTNGGRNGNHGQATRSQTRPTDGGGNRHAQTAKSTDSAAAGCGDDLDACILGLEKAVGSAFYQNILREYGRVNQPKLIRDAATKRKVLKMLESATRGFDRLEAVTKRLEPNAVDALLAKLQAPSLREIADIKTLQTVVLGLEELAGPTQPHAAQRNTGQPLGRNDAQRADRAICK